MRFAHAVSVRSQNNALMNESLEGFVKVEITHIPKRLRKEARKQKVHTGVFRTAHINVDGQELINGLRIEGRFFVVCVRVS